MEIIHENEYLYKMNDEIEPYLATHRQEGYISGAEDHLHRKDTGDSGENSCTALPGREAERRDYNQSWLYRSSAEI